MFLKYILFSEKIFSAIFLLIISFSSISFSQSKQSDTPVFHGATIIGNYPATDFLFTLPVTGEKPITFSAKNLPDGLTLDASTGIIKGKIMKKGEYVFTAQASNSKGISEKQFTVSIGEKLCLSPPMGWNSWNVFASEIDEKMLMEIADAMVATGMRDLGYQYINIDDFWHNDTRDNKGKPLCDSTRFPNGIKFLADYVHSKGLKLGIYSCAGNMTCGRCFGGFGYEEIDAQTYSEWGIDLLKYDYCYAPWNRKAAIERYSKMGTALKNSGRSIVFSVCEWGLRKPWLWAADAGGHYWRTTPDIFDTWKGGNAFMMSVMKILKRQRGLEKYAAPGKWNDPDMLTVGNYGKGKATSAKGMYKGMSDTEYRSEMSLWCMLNAPLLASCDLRNMNNETLEILTNPEIIAINQDILGEQASRIYKTRGIWIYMKSLAGGGKAVAILNTASREKSFTLKAEMLDIKGMWNVRDVWKHQDLPLFAPAPKPGTTGELIGGNNLNFTIQPHETIVLTLTPWIEKRKN